MDWSDQKTRLRYFLRDPDGSLWSDVALKHIYNDEQKEFQQEFGMLELVKAISVPQSYGISYMFDWEWQYISDEDQAAYQCFTYHNQSDMVYCHIFLKHILKHHYSDQNEFLHHL